MKRIAILIVASLVIWACGPSPKEQLLTKMAEVKQALHDLEKQAPGDAATADFLAECEQGLADINGLMVEGDEKKALSHLNILALQVERFDPLSLADESAPISIRGTVEFVKAGQSEFIKLTTREDPFQIRQLRTGIQSSTEIRFPSGRPDHCPS